MTRSSTASIPWPLVAETKRIGVFQPSTPTEPSPSAPSRSRCARSAAGPMSALVTRAMSGISTMPALMNCRLSPGARLGREHDRVGEVGDLGLGLADAHGLDQHHVVDGAHQHHGGGAQVGEPAQAVACRHGAHEHALVVRVDIDPGAVAEQRAARPPRRWVDRDHPDGAAGGAPGARPSRRPGSTCRRPAARSARSPRPGAPAQAASSSASVASACGAASISASARASAALPPCRSSARGVPSLKTPAWPAAPPAPPPAGRSARGRASRRRSRGRRARRIRPRPGRRHARRRCRA